MDGRKAKLPWIAACIVAHRGRLTEMFLDEIVRLIERKPIERLLGEKIL
ncbi:MAG: hypothetical protein HQK81_11625 [Desulfovibrionaceae bacterium]|nr:hypothetical protein [Desulfovibrionaceae bacterium]MBF0514692.1 hypothetical protein [Desulfovibrionaceae bacterium]